MVVKIILLTFMYLLASNTSKANPQQISLQFSPLSSNLPADYQAKLANLHKIFQEQPNFYVVIEGAFSEEKEQNNTLYYVIGKLRSYEIYKALLENNIPPEKIGFKATSQSTLEGEYAPDPMSRTIVVRYGANLKTARWQQKNSQKKLTPINNELLFHFPLQGIYPLEEDDNTLKTFLFQPDFKDAKITIEGHADKLGTSQLNKNLSQLRAFVIYEQVTRLGFPTSRIQVNALADSQLLDNESNENAHAKNRRVRLSWDKTIPVVAAPVPVATPVPAATPEATPTVTPEPIPQAVVKKAPRKPKKEVDYDTSDDPEVLQPSKEKFKSWHLGVKLALGMTFPGSKLSENVSSTFHILPGLLADYAREKKDRTTLILSFTTLRMESKNSADYPADVIITPMLLTFEYERLDWFNEFTTRPYILGGLGLAKWDIKVTEKETARENKKSGQNLDPHFGLGVHFLAHESFEPFFETQYHTILGDYSDNLLMLNLGFKWRH